MTTCKIVLMSNDRKVLSALMVRKEMNFNFWKVVSNTLDMAEEINGHVEIYIEKDK